MAEEEVVWLDVSMDYPHAGGGGLAGGAGGGGGGGAGGGAGAGGRAEARTEGHRLTPVYYLYKSEQLGCQVNRHRLNYAPGEEVGRLIKLIK